MAEHILGRNMSLISRLAVPPHGLEQVSQHAFAEAIREAEVMLGSSVSLFSKPTSFR
jgi:hypothetical protein